MSNTKHLGLPYIEASQAQKHVTHNEALRALDAVVQLSVLNRSTSSPPAQPSDGDRFIVAAGATGDWTGKEQQIAAWQDNAWAFYPPETGWSCWLEDEEKLLTFQNPDWIVSVYSSLNPAPLVGINAAADTTNRLSVSAPASLFNHEGNGHQLKLNKNTAADTASLLYQTAFSGRAEIGLSGDDDLHIKVSDDGLSWREGLIIDRASGRVSFPRTILPGIGANALINGDFTINQRDFPGGALASGSYGYDRWKAGASGASLSLGGDTLTLASGSLMQIIEAPHLAGREVTVSVEDLSGGDLDIDIEAETGSIQPDSGRRGTVISIPAGATGNITLKISPSSAAVSFKRIKLEPGQSATPWQGHSEAVERFLCWRYFYRIKYVAFSEVGVARQHSATSCRFLVRFPAAMHTAPVMSHGPLTDWMVYANGATSPVSSIGYSAVATGLEATLNLATSGLTGNHTAGIRIAGSTATYLQFDAEM